MTDERRVIGRKSNMRKIKILNRSGVIHVIPVDTIGPSIYVLLSPLYPVVVSPLQPEGLAENSRWQAKRRHRIFTHT